MVTFRTNKVLQRGAVYCLSVWVSFLLAGCDRNATGADAPYPTRAVTVVVPWAAGGGTDRVARFWADAFRQSFGRPFTVVNRTGGAGVVGHTATATAAPNGHTIGIATIELVQMRHMGLTALSYEAFDFIIQMNADPAGVIVRKDAPWQNINELIDDIRRNPGKLHFSGTGVGGIWDLSRIGMMLAADLPVDSTVWVPSQGATPAIVELLGGHIDVITCSLPEAQSQLESGDLRALAVMGDERLPQFPDVPTLKESGIDWTSMAWRGIVVPKGTPPEILEILRERAEQIVHSDAYREFMARNGFGIASRVGDDFARYVAEQDRIWGEIIRASGYGK